MDPSHTEPEGARQFEPRCRLSILHLPSSTFLPSLLFCSVFPESNLHSSPPASSPSPLSLSFSLPLPLFPTRMHPNSSSVFHRCTCSVHTFTPTRHAKNREIQARSDSRCDYRKSACNACNVEMSLRSYAPGASRTSVVNDRPCTRALACEMHATVCTRIYVNLFTKWLPICNDSHCIIIVNILYYKHISFIDV